MYSARPVCLVVVLLAACHGGGGESFGLDHRVEVAALPLPDGLPDPLPVQWTNAFPALVFDQPVLLTAPPDGTDRVVVVEQPGRVRVFANDADVTAVGTFLDLSAQVQFGGEEGLLGFAFHPAYATNGWFYVYYTAPSPRRSVLSRFTVSGDPDVADPASEVILLEFEQPYGNHNAGSLAFGPDGKLYVASGDGGQRQRSARQRPVAAEPARQDPAPRTRRQRAARQSVRRHGGRRARGDLGLRAAQPVAHELRPGERAAVGRRRRPGRA